LAIEPPDTDDTDTTSAFEPVSTSAASEPNAHAVARWPPPETATPMLIVDLLAQAPQYRGLVHQVPTDPARPSSTTGRIGGNASSPRQQAPAAMTVAVKSRGDQ